MAPYDGDLWAYVAKPTETSDRDEESKGFEQLFNLCLRDDGGMRYHIPRIVPRLDPNGFVVPELLAEKIRAASGDGWEEITKWSTFAGHYRGGTPQWETMARLACEAAQALPSGDRSHVYFSLEFHEPVVHSGRIGEVSARWQMEVDAARGGLDGTAMDDPLRGYWRFRFESAKADLVRETRRVEEEEEGGEGAIGPRSALRARQALLHGSCEPAVSAGS